MDTALDILRLPLRPDLRLAIDSGGSTLRMAVCDLDGVDLEYVKIAYPQQRYGHLEAAIVDFLTGVGLRPGICVVGAAGPIEKGRSVKLTNNPDWPVFDAVDAENKLGIKFHLFNDLVIAAASLAVLKPDEIETIRVGDGAEVDHETPRLVTTISTGVNDAVALPDSMSSVAYLPTESGHMSFAPRNEVEIELLKWCWYKGHDYVGFEDLTSGSNGYRRVFEFVVEALDIQPLESTVQAVKDVPIGPPLTEAGLTKNDPAALKVFEIIGGITGTYIAARIISTLSSAVYMVGSVSQHKELFDFYLDKSPFLERLTNAGPYDRLVKGVPIFRILHKDFGMVGARRIACQL